jgi:hypothetical protein
MNGKDGLQTCIFFTCNFHQTYKFALRIWRLFVTSYDKRLCFQKKQKQITNKKRKNNMNSMAINASEDVASLPAHPRYQQITACFLKQWRERKTSRV